MRVLESIKRCRKKLMKNLKKKISRKNSKKFLRKASELFLLVAFLRIRTFRFLQSVL